MAAYSLESGAVRRVAHLVLLLISFVSSSVLAQEVDPRVQPIDATVQLRVQDPDDPDSAAGVGNFASSSWQPMTLDAAYAAVPASSQRPASKSGQSASTFGITSWGPLPANSVASTSTPTSTQISAPTTRTNGRRKLNSEIVTAERQWHSMGHSLDEEISLERSLSDESANAKLTMLKRALARSPRARTRNTLQAKQSVNIGLWAHDSWSASELQQRTHEEGQLLHSGYNGQSEDRARRRRGHHHKAGIADR